MNNGFATKRFNLERGVRQGCRLSGILFTFEIEILASTNDIKGIEIGDRNTKNLTHYADDITVFHKDVQSQNNLL